MREYELMVILNPEVEDQAVEPTLSKFLEIVTKIIRPEDQKISSK